MTDELAREAAERVAAAMGRGWRASDGALPLDYRFLDGRTGSRKRCRLEYGDDDSAFVAYQGDSWFEALDEFFNGEEGASAWRRDILEKLGGASSVEELILKTAVAGETRETPRA